MEKSLYAAPQGMSSMPAQEVQDIEFSIEGEDAVPQGVGLVVVEVAESSFGENLAEKMEDGELASISTELLEAIEADIESRKEWTDTFTKGLEVLGMKYEERTQPWVGACGVFSTVLTEAAIRFQSETIMETFPAAGPVKVEIVGEETPEKVEASVRVRDDMNYQLTEVMQEYRPEHERMLFSLGLSGAAFKKVYFDPALDRQVSMFVPAEDVIIPYGASSAQTAERITHWMRKTKNDVKKLQAAGFYREVDLGEPLAFSSDLDKKKAEYQGYTLPDDDRYQFMEVQVDLDLPGEEDPDGIARPYVVTLEKGSTKILAIYRNWEEDDPNKIKRQHFVQYSYIPGFGAYGMGLIHLIGGYARAGTIIIRELIDAGELSNLPGGMKTRGLRILGDTTPIGPGEWRDVDVTTGALRDSIMPLPYKEPSQVLMALLNQITEEARRLGAISDMNISDMSANAPVGTTLALLERTLKTMSAVQARVHASMKQEFKLLAAIRRDHSAEEYDYVPVDGKRSAKRADYEMTDVIPVSDPNSATMAQRIMQYQAALQLAATAPQIYDMPLLHRQMLEVLGIKNAAKLIPLEDDMKPVDPISENMAFLKCTPVKAFLLQDHESHLTAHNAFIQDPLVMKNIGQNPQVQAISAAAMAHIAEHTAFAYRKQMEEQLGVSLPQPNAELTPEVEVQLSQLIARGAQQLLQVNKTQQAQQEAQQQQQDPQIQMKLKELDIKGLEAQIKAKKVDADIELDKARFELEQQKAAGESPQIAQQQAAQQAQQAEQSHQQQLSMQAQQAQQAQQVMQQQQALKAQQLAQGVQHKQQAHAQGLTHKQQAHMLKMELQQQAARQQAAKLAPKAKGKGYAGGGLVGEAARAGSAMSAASGAAKALSKVADGTATISDVKAIKSALSAAGVAIPDSINAALSAVSKGAAAYGAIKDPSFKSISALAASMNPAVARALGIYGVVTAPSVENVTNALASFNPVGVAVNTIAGALGIANIGQVASNAAAMADPNQPRAEFSVPNLFDKNFQTDVAAKVRAAADVRDDAANPLGFSAPGPAPGEAPGPAPGAAVGNDTHEGMDRGAAPGAAPGGGYGGYGGLGDHDTEGRGVGAGDGGRDRGRDGD